MSLRDQLLAKGLVSKKDARRTNQELRRERKQGQGERRRRREVEEEARRAEEAEVRARLERRAEARRQIAAVERELERRSRAYRIIVRNRIRCRGPVIFHYRAADGRTLARLGVHERVADALRRGRAAIVAFDHGSRQDVAVIPTRAAEHLRDIAPECVRFLVDRRDVLGPDEDVWQPEWEVSLRPHRATDEELRRFAALTEANRALPRTGA